jgi:hypothetical protein
MTNLDKRMLSNVSKMPGHSISRSARLCHVGQKLRKIKGSTCEKCYALKGMYNMPNVKQAMERREVFFHSIDFVPRMVALLSIHYASQSLDGSIVVTAIASQWVITFWTYARRHRTLCIGYHPANIRFGATYYAQETCRPTSHCECPPI